MIQSSSRIKDILFDCLNSMSENPWIYTDQDNQFSRKRKISFSDAILTTICMQRSSSKTEILRYYDFLSDAPTHSALIQQRKKLLPCAFEDLFYRFTNALSPDLKYKGTGSLLSMVLISTFPAIRKIRILTVFLISMVKVSTCCTLMLRMISSQSCIQT